VEGQPRQGPAKGLDVDLKVGTTAEEVQIGTRFGGETDIGELKHISQGISAV